jgi:glutaredoxin
MKAIFAPLLMVASSTVLMLISQGADAQLYKWTDKDGKVQYSDQPPPPDAKNAEQKRLLGVGASSAAEQSFAVREAQKRNPVTLFTSGDCGQLCISGRNLLVARGVPYTEKNVTGNKPAFDELLKAAKPPQVPVLVVGSQNLLGFETSAWDAALDGGGYPRTNTLNAQQRAAQTEAAKAAAKAPPPTPAPAAPAPATPPVPETPGSSQNNPNRDPNR